MRTLALASLLVALAACRIKGDPSYDTASAACATVDHACGAHGDCCSFACVSGVCIANVLPGGLCRTSDDCDFTLKCDAGHCRPGLVCLPTLGDVCTSNNECCSGNCLGENGSSYPPNPGTCASETAPTVELGGPFTVPYYATTVLVASVVDPDVEDVKYYAWDVVSAPTGALSGWAPSGTTPSAFLSASVFLSAKGTYVLRVRVTDGPATQRNRQTAQDSVTITAVNLPPVVSADPTLLPSTALRNTPIQLVGSVSDPNGTATPISCAWYAKPFGQPEQSTPIASWASCPASPTTSFTTPIDGPQGDWEFRLQSFDGELASSSVRVVTVVNAAPVSVACAYECQSPPAGGVPSVRAGNLGPPGAAAPAVPLHGRATDANGDVGTAGFSWEWRLVSAPAGSSLSPGLVLGSNSGTPPPFDGALDPDVVGTYVVRLTVNDGWGATASSTVPVVVSPWLRPLHPLDGTGLPRGTIEDATFVHGATAASDRLVYVGRDVASGQDRLWLLDPQASATATVPAAALAESPRCVGLAPDGASALVGGDVSGSARWERVTLGASPGASGGNLFGPGFTGLPSDVVDTGGREYAVSSTGVVHELSSSGTGSSSTAPLCENCTASALAGSHAVGTTDTIWLLSSSGELRRFTVRPNGNLQLAPNAAVAGLSATDLWLSAVASGPSQDVVLSSGAVYGAATLAASSAALPAAARHVDTAAPGGVRQGVLVAAAGATVLTLDGAWGQTGTLPLPAIGWLGTGYTPRAAWAFVRSDGAGHHVVLQATVGGSVRWFLATY